MTQFRQGGTEIDEFRKSGGPNTTGDAGSADEQGNVGIELEVRGLAPEPMFADVVTVITGKGDNGVPSQAQAIQSIEDFADLGIEVTDVRKVAVSPFGGLVLGEGDLIPLGPEQFGAVVKGDLRGAFGTTGIERRQLGAIVEVPILLRCVEGGMGLPKADREEKGSFFDLRQDLHRFGRDPTIVVGLIGNVAAFADRAIAVVANIGGREVGR